MASVTTPRFKTDFIQNEDDKRKARDLLLEQCMKTTNESNLELETGTDETDEIPEREEFFVLFKPPASTHRSSIDTSCQIEIDRYLNDTRKEITILNEYPNLKKIFFEFNTTLSSSAPVERLFSQSKLVFRPQRNRITPQNFERIVLVKANYLLTSND